MTNNRWKEQRDTIEPRSSQEREDEDDDDMGRSDGSQDFFGSESINRFDGWPIPFQALYHGARDSKVSISRCRGVCELGIGGTNSFWTSVKNRESRSVEGTRKKLITPMRNESNPSYMRVIRD